jgi:hypothetical protein
MRSILQIEQHTRRSLEYLAVGEHYSLAECPNDLDLGVLRYSSNKI